MYALTVWNSSHENKGTLYAANTELSPVTRHLFTDHFPASLLLSVPGTEF